VTCIVSRYHNDRRITVRGLAVSASAAWRGAAMEMPGLPREAGVPRAAALLRSRQPALSGRQSELQLHLSDVGEPAVRGTDEGQ
jgi:hypothetical protein